MNKIDIFLEKVAEEAYNNEMKKSKSNLVSKIIASGLFGAALGFAGSKPIRSVILKGFDKLVKLKTGDDVLSYLKRGKAANISNLSNKYNVPIMNIGNFKISPTYEPFTKTILTPSGVSENAIGHEIGHFFDMKDKNPFVIAAKRLFLNTPSEIRAWNKSPIKDSSKLGINQKRLALSAYAIDDIAKVLASGAGGTAGIYTVVNNEKKDSEENDGKYIKN